MARYEHLPIYKQAMDVAVYFEKIVEGFTRYHKYTLGTELRNRSREVVALIVKANAAHDKQPELLVLRDCLEELLILMRLAKEVRAFKSFKSFQFAAELVVSVCRQNEGWFIEFYDVEVSPVACHLGLNVVRKNRRGHVAVFRLARQRVIYGHYWMLGLA